METPSATPQRSSPLDEHADYSRPHKRVRLTTETESFLDPNWNSWHVASDFQSWETSPLPPPPPPQLPQAFLPSSQYFPSSSSDQLCANVIKSSSVQQFSSQPQPSKQSPHGGLSHALGPQTVLGHVVHDIQISDASTFEERAAQRLNTTDSSNSFTLASENMTPAQRRQRRVQLRAQRALSIHVANSRPRFTPPSPAPCQIAEPEETGALAGESLRSQGSIANHGLSNHFPVHSEPCEQQKTGEGSVDKRHARVIRNREVALKARQAAKARLLSLETENKSLKNTARHLQDINSSLKSQIQALETKGYFESSVNDLSLFTLAP